MASFVKRGVSWRAMIVRRGQRINGTFDTRQEAETWAIETEAAILAGSRPAEVKTVARGWTVADLFDRYARDVSPTKKGGRWEKTRLIRFACARRYPIFQAQAAELDGAAMAEWRDARLKEVSPWTVNRELNLISAVLTCARKEWRIGLLSNPVHEVRRPTNPRARTRRVSAEERARLYAALTWDGTSVPTVARQWTAYAFALALETAMRRGELLGMRWEHLHLDRSYVHLPDTKNGDSRDVPLNTRAVALLRLLPPGPPKAQIIPVRYHVLGTHFRDARLRVGLSDLRFHDARREALTEHSKRLSNVLELAAVSGHRTLEKLKIYYSPDPTDLAKKLG